jgi:beta-glucosidase
VVLKKSELAQLTDATRFLWATGIEDTFITAPWPKTNRTLDEYELTRHYQHWREDLELMASLGVKTARYGIPWHIVNPAKGKWDWSFADRTLGTLLELGIDPIVDLVHYGLPSWLEDAFLSPDFPHRMAEYAGTLADRFRGRIHSFTPLNEPRITAWYCGKIGWWPPFRKGWTGFVALLLALCRGIVETSHALEEIDQENVCVHVDATDLYETANASLLDEVNRRQEIVFLALDLVSGRVSENHPLHAWLLEQGANADDLEWFQANAVELSLIGINLYPMFSKKILFASSRGVRIRMPYAAANIVEQLGRLYWERYRVPIFIAETASVGSVKRRLAWMDSSVAAVAVLRREGIPMIGYTWWPMFALVTWAYRQGTHLPAYYLKQMGLWDLRPMADEDLERVATPLVERYQTLVARDWRDVGQLETEMIATKGS